MNKRDLRLVDEICVRFKGLFAGKAGSHKVMRR